MEVTFEQFRETKALSATRLGHLDVSPAYYKKMLEETEDADHFRFGSAVDCLITEPHKFKDSFYVSDSEKPSDNIASIVEGVLRDLKGAEIAVTMDPQLSIYEAFIVRNARLVGYGNKWKEETIINKVVESGSTYFKSIVESEGKAVLSSDDYNRVKRCVETLKTSLFTTDIINSHSEDMEWKWQVPITFNIGDHLCKILVDLIIIDHADQRVYIYDLKTTGKSIYSFPGSFIKFRYYLQGALYYAGVERGFDFPNTYTLEFPRFIVAEQSSNNLPFIYQMTHKDVMVGTEGGETHLGRKIKGYERLISDFEWHTKFDPWSYPREVYENKGVVPLDMFK